MVFDRCEVADLTAGPRWLHKCSGEPRAVNCIRLQNSVFATLEETTLWGRLHSLSSIYLYQIYIYIRCMYIHIYIYMSMYIYIHIRSNITICCITYCKTRMRFWHGLRQRHREKMQQLVEEIVHFSAMVIRWMRYRNG